MRRNTLVAAVLERGATDRGLRQDALLRGGGEDISLEEPFATLCSDVDRASYRVTDASVQRVRDALGSDKKAFELILAACVGAGAARWDAAVAALNGVDDAAE